MVSLSVTIARASELAKMKSGWHLTFAPLHDFFFPHLTSVPSYVIWNPQKRACSASASPKLFEPNASVQQALF